MGYGYRGYCLQIEKRMKWQRMCACTRSGGGGLGLKPCHGCYEPPFVLPSSVHYTATRLSKLLLPKGNIKGILKAHFKKVRTGAPPPVFVTDFSTCIKIV